MVNSSTLEALKSAYQQSPDNLPLLILLLETLDHAGEIEEAYKLIQTHRLNLIELPHRLLAGTICLKLNELDLALSLSPGETPQELLLQAKIYLAAGDLQLAQAAYQQAVAKDSGCQDSQLEENFRVKVPQAKEKAKAHLRLVSGAAAEPQLERTTATGINFGDIGGLTEVKKEITRKIILPFQKPSLFQRFKKKAGGGVLLYGPPGCGKTLLARATAGECQAEFYNIAISDVLDMWMGEAEKKLHAIFEQARRTTPAVIFFDEIEALAGKRQYTHSDSSATLASQFLSELDGFAANNQGVLILAATNVPWALDPAFKRPGRFDRVLFVPPPDHMARESILKILLQTKPTASDIDLDYLAAKTSGFSGADLDNLVETACDYAIEETLAREQEQVLTFNYLKQALKSIKPTTVEWLTIAHNYAKYANEAGQYDEVLAFLKKYAK